MSNCMSRRAAIGGGATLATMATTTASALAHPDAELIATCAAHIVNIAAFCAYGDLEADDDPLWLAYERTRDAITSAAPITVDGLLAIARAAKAEASNPDGTESHDNCPASQWAWLIVCALQRMNPGAA